MSVRNVITMNEIENKLVLCKAITTIHSYIGDRAFNKNVALSILLKSIKIKKPTPGRIREYIPESMTSEQAARMFNVMVNLGYIEYAFDYKPRPGEPPKLAIGTKMYRIGSLRLTECMETQWYKNRQRKEKFVKKEEHIDTRSCKALQQIYTMFGNVPFSFNTVTQTASLVSRLADDKNAKLTKAEIIALKQMKAKLYNYNEGGFREVWQKLIRNGYIVQHKIKTPDGYIKSTGLYRINPPYLRHCLAEML
jgi:hypothetical protein